jgi:cobalt/nickel transport system ATP-binding protein
MPEIYNLNNVSFSYLQSHKALTNINLKINEGEILSIIGANGTGKSTLLHLLCGLIFPSQGQIVFKGTEIKEIILQDPDFNRRFRASIGYIFQNSDAQLFCPTVIDELLFGPLQLGLSKEIANERANEILKMLNISEIKDRPTYLLSGGEKKRVAIGAVLITNPEIIIIDEPVSGLDPKTRSFFIELIFQLNEAGKTIIIATHHLELVDHLQSRVAVLNEQHTIEKTGSAEEILDDIEFLVKMNLIHEQLHRHGSELHKHLPKGFLFHKHK